MTQDVHDYQHKLTLEERHVYENVLSYLTTSDILAMRNIGLAVMEKMSAPELQIYQARQVYEEAMHTWTYQHCIETIGLDQGEIYNRYRVVPEIYHKIQMCNQRLDSVLRPDIDLNDRDELENFVLAYTFFAGVFEGTWFYNGFSPIFALQRRGLMKGTAEQLQYIMRDEVLHASFGIRVCNQIVKEENIKLDPKVIQQMWEEAEAAEETVREIPAARPDPRLQRQGPYRAVPLHRQPPRQQAASQDPVPGRGKCAALAGRAGQPEKGEKLFRNPRHRVPDRRRIELGLGSIRYQPILHTALQRAESVPFRHTRSSVVTFGQVIGVPHTPLPGLFLACCCGQNFPV